MAHGFFQLLGGAASTLLALCCGLSAHAQNEPGYYQMYSDELPGYRLTTLGKTALFGQHTDRGNFGMPIPVGGGAVSGQIVSRPRATSSDGKWNEVRDDWTGVRASYDGRRLSVIGERNLLIISSISKPISMRIAMNFSVIMDGSSCRIETATQRRLFSQVEGEPRVDSNQLLTFDKCRVVR